MRARVRDCVDSLSLWPPQKKFIFVSFLKSTHVFRKKNFKLTRAHAIACTHVFLSLLSLCPWPKKKKKHLFPIFKSRHRHVRTHVCLSLSLSLWQKTPKKLTFFKIDTAAHACGRPFSLYYEVSLSLTWTAHHKVLRRLSLSLWPACTALHKVLRSLPLTCCTALYKLIYAACVQ